MLELSLLVVYKNRCVFLFVTISSMIGFEKGSDTFSVWIASSVIIVKFPAFLKDVVSLGDLNIERPWLRNVLQKTSGAGPEVR